MMLNSPKTCLCNVITKVVDKGEGMLEVASFNTYALTNVSFVKSYNS